MKTQFHKFLINTAVLLLLLLLLPGRVLAEGYSASTIRLLYYEGNVKVLDADGKSRTLMQNGRFGSGESMQTGKESTASVGLDQSKIVALDAVTRVNFSQQGKAMHMDLVEGTLLLDVQKKLDEEESLDIRTSNMVVGIRGTVVFLSNLPSAEHDTDDLEEVLDERISSGEMITTLGVLEGTAHVSYVDANGRQQSIDVKAGEKATLRGDSMGKSASDAYVETMVAEDLSNFVVKQLMRDDALYNRVEEASGLADEAVNLYAADKEWTYDSPITLIAQSASKLYDGTPLTRSSDVLVYGLPSSFSVRAIATGSQTDAGSSKNPIGSYAILNARGEDVTKHFTDIRTVAGELVVDPQPLTVWTASAEKVYDGTPLTAPDAWLSNAPHYKKESVPWRNMAYVQPDTGDVQVLYGVCGTVWVHGTNPLTGETQEIELHAGQKLLVYLHDEKDRQTISLTLEDVKETELTDELLRLYADNPDLLGQAVKDTGWDAELMTRLINDLPDRDVDLRMVTKHDLQVEERDADSLMKDCTNVRITIDTEITDYNDRALGSEEARYTPVVIDETISVRATGSRTEVGTSTNTYSIDWGSAKSSNYVVNEELGTLTVIAPETPEENNDNPVVPTVDPTPPEDDTIKDPVVLTAASASKIYDGSPLTDNSVSVSGLPDGYTCTATAGGSRTDAGSSANTVDSYTIYDKDGNDVTSKFTNVTTVDGTLTVEAIQMDFNLGGREVDFDGSAPVPKPTFTYLNGEHAGEIVSGVRLLGSRLFAKLAAPPSKWEFSLYTGDSMSLSIQGGGSSAGTYTLVGLYDFTTGSKGNYAISYSGTTMTINPAKVTVTTGSADKTYDAEPLTCEEATITGLVGGDTATIKATGSITDAGTADNTYTIDWGTADPGNYTIEENLGTLTVDPLGVTINMNGGYSTTFTNLLHNPRSAAATFDNGDAVTRLSSKKVYDDDGNPLYYFAEFALMGTDTMELKSTGAVTVGEHEFTNTCTFTSGRKENYEISYEYNTVTINPLSVNLYLLPYSEVQYNGQLWKAVPRVGGYYWMTPAESDENTWNVTGSIKKKTLFQVTISGGGKDVGSYTYSCSVSYPNPDVGEENFDINIYDDTLEIKPAPLHITTDNDSKKYDGTPLSGGEATVEGLMSGDAITVTTATPTEVGTTDNTYTIDWGDTNKDNYTITDDIGELTITKNDTKITVTAGSASRAYNGVDLTDSSFTVEGLPGALTLEATTDGSQYIAGTTKNVITDHKILNSDGEDRTENFTNVEYVDGELEVTLKRIAFWSWPAIYTYDGWSHSSTIPFGLVRIQFASADNIQQSDLSFSFDTYRDVGSHPGTFTVSFSDYYGKDLSHKYTIIYEGPNGSEPFANVIIQPRDLTVSTTSESKVYDGELLKGSASLSGIVGGDNVKVTADTTITDVGSAANNYTIDWGTTKQENYTLIEDLGTLTVTPATLTVVTDSDTKTYDGTPLTAGADLEGLIPHDDATVVATGSITEPGKTVNTYRIDWGTTNPDNYVIVEKLGQLSITNGEPAPLTVITESASKTYDGTPLTADARLVGLKKGADATVKATGTITHAGSTKNTYEIDWGDTDPNDYTITEDFGTLTVDKADLTVTTDSDSKTYDGKPLTATGASLEGLCGTDDASATATGTITNAGSTKNGYEITWNSASRDDYTIIKEELGTLTVEKAVLRVRTGYDYKEYDGTPLTCDEAELDGLQNGETAQVKATGTITDIGYTENTYEITWGTANPDNYKIKEYLGWLNIYDPDDPEIPDVGPLLSSPGPKSTPTPASKSGTKQAPDAAKDSKTEKGSTAENESNVEDGSTAEKSSETIKDSEAEKKSETETNSEAEAGKNPEAETNSGSEQSSGADKGSETEQSPETVKVPEPEKKPEPEKVSEPEKKPEPVTVPEPETKPEQEKVSEPENKPEPVTMPEPEKKPETEKVPDAENKPEA